LITSFIFFGLKVAGLDFFDNWIPWQQFFDIFSNFQSYQSLTLFLAGQSAM